MTHSYDFFVGMNLHVTRQRTVIDKGLVTHMSRVRPFAGINFHVTRQRTTLVMGFIIQQTRAYGLSRVYNGLCFVNTRKQANILTHASHEILCGGRLCWL